MRTLGRRASFATAALTAALALWTSGAPSVVYPLYGRDWQLTPAVTTAVFATYPLALVVVLLLLGGLSDTIGRRASILLGLIGMALGTLLFALAPDVVWIFVGRALTGVGVGLALSPATAALTEFAAPGTARRAGAIATASTAAGLTGATLIGGALVAHAPDPLHLSFWALLVVLVVAILLASRLPHLSGERRRFRVQLPHVDRSVRPVVVRATLAVGSAFVVGAMVLSLGADIAAQLTGTSDALVIGAVLAVSSVSIGVTALLARGVRPERMIPAGTIVLLVGLATLVTAGVGASLPLLFAAMVVAGVGYSLLFAGGLTLASVDAPAHHRAATLSLVYLGGYTLQGVAAVALGQVATDLGLLRALEFGAPVIAALAVAAALASLLRSRAPLPVAPLPVLEGIES
jgi:MFS family permease